MRSARVVLFAAVVSGCWDHRGGGPTDIEVVGAVIVSPAAATLEVGTTRQFTAAVVDELGNVMHGRPVTWLSANPQVATVDETGLVTALEPGTGTIRATSDGVGGSAAVTVTPTSIRTIDVIPVSAQVSVGGTIRFTATATSQIGQSVTGVRMRWSSSHPTVATVDSTGLATGITHGVTAIRAAVGDVYGEVLLSVGAAPHGLAWSMEYSSAQASLATLYGIWGSSATDVFAAGGDEWAMSGVIVLHYNGASWRPMDFPATYLLADVWGTSATNVYAVGSGIFRYDGSAWRQVTVPVDAYFHGVWGSSAEDVYAVGSSALVHFDGTSWREVGPPTAGSVHLADVWGSSASDVFVVGSNGLILHYDGTRWATMPSPTTKRLRGVWGSSPTDVYAVADGLILHYDGVSWRVIHDPPMTEVTSVWGTSASDVYVVGCSSSWWSSQCLIMHYDGTTWAITRSPSDQFLTRVWGTSSSNAWAVGAGMVILRGGR